MLLKALIASFICINTFFLNFEMHFFFQISLNSIF